MPARARGDSRRARASSALPHIVTSMCSMPVSPRSIALYGFFVQTDVVLVLATSFAVALFLRVASCMFAGEGRTPVSLVFALERGGIRIYRLSLV